MHSKIRENETPLLSVIIPVYNTEKYLERCISSVVTQSYKNLEIFLVDDGSTDRSSEICDNWAERDSRIHVCHKINEGPGAARNIGIKMSEGGYITFIDSDDWIEPDMYEKMLEAAIKTGSEIVGCPSVLDFDDGTHRKNHADVTEGFKNKNQCIIDFLEGNKNAWGAVHNKLYKSELWHDVRFPTVNHLEDYVVSAKLFNESNAVYFCAHPYYHHTVNTSSLSMSGWNQSHLTIPATTDMICSYLRTNCSDAGVIKATYRFRFLMDVSVLWDAHKAKSLDARQIRKNMRKRSLEGFREYAINAKKKKSDLKVMIKFFLSLID